jgi:histidine ammonia-lyase
LALVRARAARVKQALFRGAEMLRKYVEHLHVDRPLYNDHNAMKDLVKRCEILEEVEKAVGELD